MYQPFFYGILQCILVCSVYAGSDLISNCLTKIELTELYSGIKSIDCIYVINLDERYERWDRTQTLCKNNGLFVNRVSAVNGWKLEDRIIRRLTTPQNQITKGAIGCLLSHLSILQHALAKNFETIWVMEDDIDFLQSPHQIRPLLKELSKIDPDWDLFYTDVRIHWNYVVKPIRKKDYITDNLLRVGRRYGTHSIIISKNGMKKIFNYFSSKRFSTPIDIDIHSIPGIRKYSPAWHITTVTESSFSDTELPVH